MHLFISTKVCAVCASRDHISLHLFPLNPFLSSHLRCISHAHLIIISSHHSSLKYRAEISLFKVKRVKQSPWIFFFHCERMCVEYCASLRYQLETKILINLSRQYPPTLENPYCLGFSNPLRMHQGALQLSHK